MFIFASRLQKEAWSIAVSPSVRPSVRAVRASQQRCVGTSWKLVELLPITPSITGSAFWGQRSEEDNVTRLRDADCKLGTGHWEIRRFSIQTEVVILKVNKIE